MAFTEFYCDASAGANINAGDKTANGVVTSTNGDWGNAVANRFTAASGTPFSGVSVGDFASVYLDGATTAVYIARVTAVNGGGASLDLSTTAIGGTAPTTGATGRSCTTGGAWNGPNGTDPSPITLVTNALMNVASDPVRVNLKNGTNYTPTATVNLANAGPIKIQGYTTSPGDGGLAIIDGGSPSASFAMLSISGQAVSVQDCIVRNNGTTSGTQALVTITGTACLLRRFVAHGSRGIGININGAMCQAIECEAYDCNNANTLGSGGIVVTVSNTVIALLRCISHHNVGSNNCGIVTGIGSTRNAALINCIVANNGSHGWHHAGGGTLSSIAFAMGLDAYENGGSGALVSQGVTGATLVCIENSNFVKNGGYGLSVLETSTGRITGDVANCGFGSGAQANTSGDFTSNDAVAVSESVTYANNVTPWVDPANGDFRINLAAAKGTGRGSYTQTASGYAGTVGYPDRGAAQHQEVSRPRLILGI